MASHRPPSGPPPPNRPPTGRSPLGRLPTNRWYPAFVSFLVLLVAVGAFRYARRAGSPPGPPVTLPPEVSVVDTSAPPKPGTPLRVALVSVGRESRTGYGSYSIEVNELCHSKIVPTWLAPGATVWLYADDGRLGRGTLSEPRYLRPRGHARCFVEEEVRGVQARAAFVVAAPHGHGLRPVKAAYTAQEEDDIASFPEPIAQWFRAKVAGAESFTAAAWTLESGQTLVSLTLDRNDGSAGKSIELGWIDGVSGAYRAVANDCNAGTVAGVFDLDRDGRPEIAVTAPDRTASFCAWDGKKFRHVR